MHFTVRIACHVYFPTLVIDSIMHFSFMMAVSMKKLFRQEWKGFASSLTILTQEERYARRNPNTIMNWAPYFYASSFTSQSYESRRHISQPCLGIPMAVHFKLCKSHSLMNGMAER
jgi:hypothetical protein